MNLKRIGFWQRDIVPCCIMAIDSLEGAKRVGIGRSGQLKVVDIAKPAEGSLLSIPSFLSAIKAGFPSPAEDYIEKKLDINELVVQHPAATFFVKVEGDSMIEAGIFSGDILVVDRSIEAKSGKIVVAIVNGEFTVKRLKIDSKGVYLLPENPKYPPIHVGEGTECSIWGVVSYIIHKAN